MLLWAQDFRKAGLLFFAFLWVRESAGQHVEKFVHSSMEEGQSLQHHRLWQWLFRSILDSESKALFIVKRH